MRDLLISMARKHKAVIADPSPSVLFRAFGDSSLDFEWRVWVDDVWRVPMIRSGSLFSGKEAPWAMPSQEVFSVPLKEVVR